MARWSTWIAVAVASVGLWAGANPAAGSPLTLTVLRTRDDATSLFRYEFRLILDDNDGSWSPGQGFGGLIFGDVPEGEAPSPLADFVLDPGSIPVGPWTGLGLASGFHNGPVFVPEINDDLEPVVWVPAGIGDALTWSGLSAYADPDCSLRFSTLFTTDGGVAADFQEVVCVPEPSASLQLLAAVPAAIGCAASARRRRRARPD